MDPVGLLRLAARLAPADVRREWLRDWSAEVRYAERRRARPRARLLVRCLGAFVHAAWLRWDRWRLEMLLQDLRFAVRTLARRPGFAAVTVATLAVGIGANAAIFSAVRAVLLRPLPFPAPEQLVQVSSTTVARPTVAFGAASPPDFVDWRQQSSSFTEMAAINAGSIPWSGHGSAEQLPYAMVTGGFFDVLGVGPLHGRLIAPEDDPPGAPDVVVISHALWVRRLGSDPAIVGRTLTLDGTARRVVGVMPPGFDYPLGSELWVPLRFTADDLATQRGAHYLDVVARRRAGVPAEAAQAELSAIVRRLAETHPPTNRDKAVAVIGLREAMVGDVRPAMVVLLGAVGMVLLIVCVNVASLALTRAAGRTRELAVRTALGAGRMRLILGLLAESLVLALCGGGAGLLLAFWASRGIARVDAGLGVPLLDQTRVDGAVVAFTLAVALGAVALFGLLPAVHASASRDVAQRIREEAGTATPGAGRQRLRGGLIVAETALAVVLLVGAGLLARSFMRVVSVDLGLGTSGVQTFGISLPEAKYPTPAARATFVETLLDRLAAHPDVEAAGAVFGLPLTNFRYGISMSTLDGRQLSDVEQDERTLQVRIVTPDYFRAMDIPIVRGRAFEANDRLGAAPVVVLNRAAAEFLWPGKDPLGHHFTLGTRMGQGGERAGGLVVGVAGDVRDFGPVAPVRPTVYLAHAQRPIDFLTVTIETRGEPAALVAPARALLSALDPDLPMFRVRTMERLAADAVAQPRLYLLLLGLFAVVAVLLAALGIYGVLMHAVVQRTREIGIRLALGAAPTEVIRLVVKHAAGLALAGLGLGLALALGASRFLERLLFGVARSDAATYAAVSVGLLAVALVAAYLPARRASRIDPIEALRCE